MSHFRPIIAVFMIFALIMAQCPAIMAQDPGYIEDDGNALWDEQQFLDTTGREFETQDTQYVGEEEIKAAEEAALEAGLPSINLVAALERDRDMMPANLQYGLITGGVMGAWFSMLQGSTARQNAQFLSLGLLGGVILSIVVGTKSLFSQSPQSVGSLDTTDLAPSSALSSLDSSGFSFGVTDTGKDLGATLSYEVKF